MTAPDRPIIFSAPMVTAILAGTKTMTRRALKPQPGDLDRSFQMADQTWHVVDSRGGHMSPLSVPYTPGQRLWVREAHHLTDDGHEERVVYAADKDAVREHLVTVERMQRQLRLSDEWAKPHRTLRSPIHMPRWASRLTFTVSEVKVERLQDISEEDARAEGLIQHNGGWVTGLPWEGQALDTARRAFSWLWEDTHGPDAWAQNPWVVAIRFSFHRGNIDDLSRTPPEIDTSPAHVDRADMTGEA